MNIKPCMGHISGTWELFLCEYWRKSMIIGEKNTDLKRLTGRLKLHFWQKLGDFIETKAKKSPTLPALVSPAEFHLLNKKLRCCRCFRNCMVFDYLLRLLISQHLLLFFTNVTLLVPIVNSCPMGPIYISCSIMCFYVLSEQSLNVLNKC